MAAILTLLNTLNNDLDQRDLCVLIISMLAVSSSTAALKYSLRENLLQMLHSTKVM